ncbi:MAG: hypothetical protein KBT02_10310 [Treponema sp.]|nr:hypothetical protein [Candidatus Treponema caballi]
MNKPEGLKELIENQTPKIVVTGNWRDIDAAMSIYDKEKLYELSQITPGGEYIYELRRGHGYESIDNNN